MKFLKSLLRDEAGATAIEYGLIAALIAVAAITAMSSLGDTLEDTFNETAACMSGEAVNGSDCPAPAAGG